MEQREWCKELLPVQVREGCQWVRKDVAEKKGYTLSFTVNERKWFLFTVNLMSTFGLMKFLVTVAFVFAFVKKELSSFLALGMA